MVRTLMATTALAALLATGAYAQEATQPVAPAAPMTDPAAPAAPVVQPADGFLATNLIGETVYNGTGDDAQNIGNVNDLVIASDGSVESIIVGVGGFLGLGQRNVALNYDEINWAEGNGDRWSVVAATKEQLEALPEFDTAPYNVAPVAATDPAAPASDSGATAPAPAEPAAPADNQAAAPADTAAPAQDQAAAPATTDTPAATDSTSTAAIDRSTLTEIPAGELRSEELTGTTVYGADDANVGEIGDVLMTQDGQVDAVIIDVGGFLGIGEKEVAVGMDKLSFMRDADGNKYLYTTFTKEQLEAAPAYDAGTYAEQRDTQRLIVQ